MSKSTPKVALEVAESEFERMCTAHRIDTDVSAFAPDELAEWLALKGGIVRDIQSATVVVGESGDPTYHVPGGKSYTLRAATGSTLMALETYANTKQIGNMVAAMAEMAQVDRGEFGRMHARDVQAISRIAKLFLADR